MLFLEIKPGLLVYLSSAEDTVAKSSLESVTPGLEGGNAIIPVKLL